MDCSPQDLSATKGNLKIMRHPTTFFLTLLLWWSSRMTQATKDCSFTRTKRNPFIHKPSYTVGVHAVDGLDEVLEETQKVFSEYLTATAGQTFDPPIEFKVVPYHFTELFTAIDTAEIDLLYANPGIFTCAGVQGGATALATVSKAQTTRGSTFDLDIYGGVIATRHDNDDINAIADLKGKIIGAGSIIDLMGGQMQIYEMEKNGLSYVNDPKQVVFTNDQVDVVKGILDGSFDAGFIRTNQIEVTTDDEGKLLDPNLFKIIDPKIFVMESGELFPFLHSTDILPEWPLAALPTVPADVQQAIQDALKDFGDYALIGLLQQCSQASVGKNDTYECLRLDSKTVTLRTPCNATNELVMLAAEASQKSRISSFRTALSYFHLQTVLEEAGFLVQDKNGWRCLAPANLYEAITCPEGHFKRNQYEFDNGCTAIGLSCDGEKDYDCFCKPCIKAFDVDVYPLPEGEEDMHLRETYEESLPGCAKMTICGTVEQRKSIAMRVYDNMLRDGAKVEVKIHAGDREKLIEPTNIPGTYAYEFRVSDNEARAQVIEVFVNGEPISESPVRVMVVEGDCDAVYGTGSNRIADTQGFCVCAGNTYEMLGTCLDSAAFFLIIFASVIVAIGIMLFFYLGYKRKQSDSVWHINVEELHFNEPPEIIGAGGFGVVILGQYRGTKVAVKRVLPPSKLPKDHSASITSGQNVGVGSAEIIDATSQPNDSKTKSMKTKKRTKGHVKFGEAVNVDIESQQIISKSESVQLRESTSGSNKDWERLMMMHHSDNDILKMLESATSSDHGSGAMFDGTVSKSAVLLKHLPMWLRFDGHARRVNEFVNEMRMLSRLRHPCITTVMGAVVASAVDPMLGKYNGLYVFHLHLFYSLIIWHSRCNK